MQRQLVIVINAGVTQNIEQRSGCTEFFFGQLADPPLPVTLFDHLVKLLTHHSHDHVDQAEGGEKNKRGKKQDEPGLRPLYDRPHHSRPRVHRENLEQCEHAPGDGAEIANSVELVAGDLGSVAVVALVGSDHQSGEHRATVAKEQQEHEDPEQRPQGLHKCLEQLPQGPHQSDQSGQAENLRHSEGPDEPVVDQRAGDHQGQGRGHGEHVHVGPNAQQLLGLVDIESQTQLKEVDH
mmetsp:Transcript_98943/g.264601  ORF Transcript_98943/g.264601 Transcript_98943/m.264601 type:complete len:237 (-) Transcript_98943:358-1068(-)